jgi:hypothetical protein
VTPHRSEVTVRRTLLVLAAGLTAAVLVPAPASASHPCLNWDPLLCALTRPCVKDICT